MSFEEEWAQQKGEVAERHSSQMRLNQLPADQGATPQPPLLGSSSSPDLATTPAKKKKAANSIENNIEPGTRTAADAADESVRGAIAEFTGWETATGLKKAHHQWDEQVKRLMGRLSQEKSALRNTAVLFSNNDLETEAGFAPVKSSKVSGI
ncbi:hypothetical protein [Streptomyces sp. NBC_00059]|uniref:hypothetical protein n=1 Tax=Streptomyces sp. NBC_00059 TaxID=2975635 RepID=UPI00225654AC|nr:hypothetical protein [Streptomyces sp. NBC_00059]MCX5413558.1 hypothetical protein [Streptomyces sp. NBC_00059]